MSGSQIAHFLKQAGAGSEWAGIGAVYHAGKFVGVCQALTAMIAVYAVHRFGKWGYEKLQDYLKERGYIEGSSNEGERAYGRT